MLDAQFERVPGGRLRVTPPGGRIPRVYEPDELKWSLGGDRALALQMDGGPLIHNPFLEGPVSPEDARKLLDGDYGDW